MTAHRRTSDPEQAGVGVEGNTRLTAANGVVLLALLAVEGFTILSIRQMITLHVFLGIALLGPVLLKTGSTLYRFTRYYTGSPPYVCKGPPHPVLRLLGPLVILSSLTLLGTGIALLAVPPDQPGLLLTAHKATFIIWVAVMTIHVLGHLPHAARSSRQELRRPTNTPATRRRGMRVTAIVLALILGAATATALMPIATPWTTSAPGRHDR